MSSHSCRIGKASPQCGCRNGFSDYQLGWMLSCSCHIGMASPQCGCMNVSSGFQLLCLSNHNWYTCKAYSSWKSKSHSGHSFFQPRNGLSHLHWGCWINCSSWPVILTIIPVKNFFSIQDHKSESALDFMKLFLSTLLPKIDIESEGKVLNLRRLRNRKIFVTSEVVWNI